MGKEKTMNSNYACATEQGYANHVRRNDAPCRVCKSWKQKHDAGEAAKPAPVKAPKTPKATKKAKPKPKPEPRERERPDCGTTAGFHFHVNHGEPIDEDCRVAYRAYQREQYAKRNGKPKQQVRPDHTLGDFTHGEPGGRYQHQRRGTEICGPCRESYNAHQRARKAGTRSTAPRKAVAECGTPAGYVRHENRNEPICQPCRDARNQRRRAKRAARKKAQA